MAQILIDREELLKAVEEINAYYAELEGESPRAAAILSVSSLEDELESLLLKQFSRTITPKAWKDIAGPGPTPLGSFKAKNDFGFAFGFYGKKTKSVLHHISAVRNRFAHDTSARDFNSPRIFEECCALAENAISPFVCVSTTSTYEIRLGFISLVEELEKRLAEIRAYIPEIDTHTPVPLP